MNFAYSVSIIEWNNKPSNSPAETLAFIKITICLHIAPQANGISNANAV